MFIAIYKSTTPLLEAFSAPSEPAPSAAASKPSEAPALPPPSPEEPVQSPRSAKSEKESSEKNEEKELAELNARRGPLLQQLMMTLTGLHLNLLDDKRDSQRSTPLAKVLFDGLQVDMKTWKQEVRFNCVFATPPISAPFVDTVS